MDTGILPTTIEHPQIKPEHKNTSGTLRTVDYTLPFDITVVRDPMVPKTTAQDIDLIAGVIKQNGGQIEMCNPESDIKIIGITPKQEMSIKGSSRHTLVSATIELSDGSSKSVVIKRINKGQFINEMKAYNIIREELSDEETQKYLRFLNPVLALQGKADWDDCILITEEAALTPLSVNKTESAEEIAATCGRLSIALATLHNHNLIPTDTLPQNAGYLSDVNDSPVVFFDFEKCYFGERGPYPTRKEQECKDQFRQMIDVYLSDYSDNKQLLAELASLLGFPKGSERIWKSQLVDFLYTRYLQDRQALAQVNAKIN